MIKPLPLHPLPNPNETIGQWIENLADTNKMSFKLMFLYINIISTEIGFFQALNKLTKIPIDQISNSTNEFKEGF